MDLIKSYIVQLFKSSSKRLRVPNSDKDSILEAILTKLENCDDIFPELKQMERVYGLEEVSSKLLEIYKRMNSKFIDFERISMQYVDDRDTIISSLRRYVLSSEVKKNINKTAKRTKYVFDDTTSTFYEIKDDFDLNKEKSDDDKILEKIDIAEFLKESKAPEIKPLEPIEQNLKIEEEKPVLENETYKEEDVNIELKGLEIITNSEKIEKEKVETEEQKIELKYDIEELEASIIKESEPIIVKEEKINVESNEDNQVKDEVLNRKTTAKEKAKKEDLTPTLFETEQPKIEEAPKHEKKYEFLDFENDLLNNIKLVDEYLFKFLSKIINPEFESLVISEAERLKIVANELGHEMIAKLIKTYWLALLAMKEKKLAATKNEAEIIRSTLIIIVALIKNKDIDLTPYWTNHQLLINKLKDISYEV